ncbi:MAG: PHP domain-containing protein [Bryobacteraceae bacterium]|nr:PHP domain-containing protein [Bryobacteraceae bacterium]
MKCDLHIHTLHSGMCTVPVARNFCRECYTVPQEAYEKLKRMGMDLVTVTDHDSIDAVEDLRHYADFFVSEEVTCHLPSGHEAHIAVYDISDRQHIEVQRRRDDLSSLLAYLSEQDLLFSVNHLFSGLTGQRSEEDYEWFESSFSHMESLNGAIVGRANELAVQYAGYFRKTGLGGSDAHTVAAVGSAYTMVRGARNKQEYLDGIRQGHAVALGSSGGYLRLTRDVLLICKEMMRSKPWTLALSPLLLGVPVVLFVNYWSEVAFAERWFGRATGRKGVALGNASVPGEASL